MFFAGVKRDIKKPGHHSYWLFYVVYGQKPLLLLRTVADDDSWKPENLPVTYCTLRFHCRSSPHLFYSIQRRLSAYV